MAIFSNLSGTMQHQFRLGKNGSTLEFNLGTVNVKDYTNTNLIPISIGEPTIPSNAVTLNHLDTNYVTKLNLSSSGGAGLIGTQQLITVQNYLNYISLAIEVKSISQLRSTEPSTQLVLVNLSSYYETTKSGGGYFYYDSTDTTSVDDGVLCFVTTNGARWKRITDGTAITPEMAGAYGDGITDDTDAFKRAIAVSKLNNYVPVSCAARSYVISDTLYLMGSSAGGSSEGSPLVGCNWKSTKLLFKPTSAIACVKLNAISGNISSCYMRDIHILPFDTSYEEIGYGLEISGACMVPFDRLFIEKMAVNYRLHNELTNTWTEFNKFNDCESRYGKVGVQFIRSGGNDSFHGTIFENFRIQVKQGGGTGIQSTGPTSAKYVWLYNCKFDVKYFGGNICYAFDIQNTRTSNNSGNFTAEGNLIFKSDNNSWFIHIGRFDTISGITYEIASEIDVKLGRFVFANRASKSTVVFENGPLTGFNSGITYGPYDISAATAAGYNFRAVGSNFNSPIFSCLSGGTNGFFFGNIGSGEGVNNFHPGFKISAGGGVLTGYNASGIELAINDVSYATLSNVSLRPSVNAGIGIGAATVRFNAAYITGWNISPTGIIPTLTATYDIGSSTNTIRNIYSQNAVTVVSDKNLKSSVQDLPIELINAVGSVKFKMWKLNSAIKEKGSDEARWHVGVIAQEVKDAITNAGLDWTRYGLITLTKTSISVLKDENGNYVPFDPNDHSLTDDNGIINFNPDTDTITVDESGFILTREIYMMRMEEFNTLRMAYIESKIN
jgi:hypothetical protein